VSQRCADNEQKTTRLQITASIRVGGRGMRSSANVARNTRNQDCAPAGGVEHGALHAVRGYPVRESTLVATVPGSGVDEA
jgi:hypothetical protein